MYISTYQPSCWVFVPAANNTHTHTYIYIYTHTYIHKIRQGHSNVYICIPAKLLRVCPCRKHALHVPVSRTIHRRIMRIPHSSDAVMHTYSKYTCMYMCMYICMYVCMYVYNILTNHAHTPLVGCSYAYLQSIYTHVCMYTHMEVIHTYNMYADTYVHICIHVLYTHIWIHLLYTYTCIMHIYTYTHIVTIILNAWCVRNNVYICMHMYRFMSQKSMYAYIYIYTHTYIHVYINTYIMYKYVHARTCMRYTRALH